MKGLSAWPDAAADPMEKKESSGSQSVKNSRRSRKPKPRDNLSEDLGTPKGIKMSFSLASATKTSKDLNLSLGSNDL